MAKIKLKDLPRDVKVSPEEMKRIRGSGLWSWWYHTVTDWQNTSCWTNPDLCEDKSTGTAGVRG